MLDVTLDTVIGGVAGATGAAGIGVLMFSKLKRMLAQDATDTVAHQSVQLAMEGLRAENARMHDEVGRLRAEIDRLRQTVTELTSKIADMGMVLSRNAVEDQLAREGKIDRRKRLGPFDSIKNPEQLEPRP